MRWTACKAEAWARASEVPIFDRTGFSGRIFRPERATDVAPLEPVPRLRLRGGPRGLILVGRADGRRSRIRRRGIRDRFPAACSPRTQPRHSRSDHRPRHPGHPCDEGVLHHAEGQHAPSPHSRDDNRPAVAIRPHRQKWCYVVSAGAGLVRLPVPQGLRAQGRCRGGRGRPKARRLQRWRLVGIRAEHLRGSAGPVGRKPADRPARSWRRGHRLPRMRPSVARCITATMASSRFANKPSSSECSAPRLANASHPPDVSAIACPTGRPCRTLPSKTFTHSSPSTSCRSRETPVTSPAFAEMG